MDTLKDKICRVCLDEGVVTDWNHFLDDYTDVTYKDCYYTYTNLNCPDNDQFSSMLCKICKTGLQDMHALIVKAVDSYNFFLEVNSTDSKIDDNVYEEIEIYPNEFETVLLKKSDDEEDFNENYLNDKAKEPCEKSVGVTEFIEEEDVMPKADITPSINKKSPTINVIKRRSTRTLSANISKKIRIEHKSEQLQNKAEKKGEVPKKTNSQNTPSMCSICSKVLANKYALQKHERTHIPNRERKEACPICGVKFYERADVVSHMHIHDEKRKKKHICEYCDKSFYKKGPLNVHRRIHLGQMIPCPVCSKEFYRQTDLDIHMNSHSEVPLNGNRKRRSRYIVHCKKCGEDILSTNYRAHEAAHLNKPLFKCLVCEKGFFSRTSITTHVKEVHKRSREEYNELIETLHDNKRLSHLLLAQTTELKSGYED